LPFDPHPTLNGALVAARPLRPADFGDLYAVAADPLIWEQHPASDRHEEARFREDERRDAPEIRIEVGGATDLDAFVELLESAATWLWNRGIHQWRPGSMRAQRPTLEQWTRAGRLVAARSGAELAGGCTLVPDPTGEWAGRSGRALYLHKLVVARSHAGRGVAREILAWCEARARASGVPRLRLDCWDGNAKLRSFYRDCGYRELEAVPSHGYSVRLFERDVVGLVETAKPLLVS
jgi:GNAT superfamily N-acetyltransferase